MNLTTQKNTEILAIEKMLDHIFADKKTVYIEDIIISNYGTYEVFWCMDFTLQTSEPEWNETVISRKKLLKFITDERLNYWEAFRYDEQTGSTQPITNVTHDVDTFLNENYRDIIKEYLEHFSL